jgi:Mor family transcriptional regulator
MTRRGLKAFPAFVDAVVATATSVLQKQGSLSEKAAKAAAFSIACALCDQFQRTHIYVPRFNEPKLADRDEAILLAYEKPGPDGVRPYTGDRVHQIAAEYGLSSVQVYNIIKYHREQEAAARPKGTAAVGS